MNGHNAGPRNPGFPQSELSLLLSDYESLVADGLLQGTQQEVAQFFSGWLASGDRIGRSSPLPLRLIVLPGLGKGGA